MPLTFIDIEKQKTWRIGVFFVLLVFMYFCVTAAFLLGIMLIKMPFQFMRNGAFPFIDNLLYLFVVFFFSLIIAAIHFFVSSLNAVKAIMNNLGAVPPDPEDGIHRRLINIVDEINIVTGNKRMMRCMVIPSLSMNAMAVSDLRGDSVIAITEGLLSRLTRSQTEAVLAHEAYHILSGDCMETTVAASLFGMYAAMIEKLQAVGEEDSPGIFPVFFLFWILLKASQLLSMFVSREREYRADAASVRMTRNPLALAEALHRIGSSWKGSGYIGSGLEMLCISGRQETVSEDGEGVWADLMSTHPPIQKRQDILLRMARASRSDLERKVMKAESAITPAQSQPLYYALNPGHQWLGPCNVADLVSFPWMSPRSWISTGPGQEVERASENAVITAALADRIKRLGHELSPFTCPLCRQALREISYEKTKVYECCYCRGILVDDARLPRIIIRREIECTERIKSLARAVTKDNQNRLLMKKLKREAALTKPLVPCPKCHNSMMRTFYSLAYLVEIDRCNYCDVTWFDADELVILQCVIENKMTAGSDILAE
jgi:heat shock protein HtpX